MFRLSLAQKTGFVGLTAVAVALMPASVSADTIHFDDVPHGTIVTDQYPQATFSSNAVNENTVINTARGPNTLPNILCSGPVGEEPNCIEDTYIDFTVPVNDLTFWAIAANFPGPTATFNVFEDGVFSGSVPLDGGAGNVFVDLSEFINVTRLEIVDILDDPDLRNGIGWDTFTFTPVSPVPAVSYRVLPVLPLLLLTTSTALLLWRRHSAA